MNTTPFKKIIKLLNRFKGLLILGLILIVPVSALVIKDPFKMFVGAAPDSVNLYFSPASISMPPNNTVSLLMDSRTNRVVFARVSGTFDRSKLQLTSEIVVNPKFTVLSKTTAQEANTTGTYTIVGIIYPQAKTIAPPSGLFSFATFSLRSISATVNDSATVAVNMSNSQIVSLEADTIPLTTQPLAVAINVSSQTPTPSPTSTTTATPGTSPTPTPTTIASSTPAVTPSPSPLTLVMGLGMNEGTGSTTFDSSSSKNNGSLLNGAIWSSTGKYGKSIQFDGVDDRVQVADANSLDLNKSGTIEAWVYPTKVNSWSTLVIKEAPQTFSYVLYGWWYGNNTAAVTNRAGEQVSQGGGQLPLNQWTHVAMTFDGSSQTLYINGTVAATSAVSGEIQNSTFPLSIGGNSLWANESFQGKIDEVRVYNMAVPQSKIQSDMTTPIISPVTLPSPTSSLSPSSTPMPSTVPTATPTPVPTGSTGLLGEYFEAADPTNNVSKLQRVDPTVNFNWGSGSPDPAIRTNNFSVRWSGVLVAPVSGQYEIYTESDDGVRLWIDNSLKIWDWSTHSVKTNRTVVNLEAGKSYPIKLEYFESSGKAVSRLLWKVPGKSKVVIPTSNLKPASSTTSLLPPPSIVTSTPLPIVVQAPKSPGLVGSYYNQTDFTQLAFTRVDATVDFDWGLFSPDLTQIGPDTYSVEWNGYVTAPADGDFTFSTVADDGVRLWVNNTSVIDDWQDHQATEKTGTIRLNVGKKYPIKLQYYDNAYNSRIRLRWSGPSIPLQLIPSTALSTQ